MGKSRAPRRTPSKDGSRRRKSAARPPRTLSAEQLARLAARLDEADSDNVSRFLAELGDNTWLVEGARARNVRLAEWLMHILVGKLRKKQRLQDVEQDFLAEALEKIIKSPTKAAQALGLIPPKARPSNGISERDWRIYRSVRTKLEASIPFKDGSPTREWNGEGAITRTAAQLHVSASTVKRAYNAVRKLCQVTEPQMEHLDKVLESV